MRHTGATSYRGLVAKATSQSPSRGGPRKQDTGGPPPEGPPRHIRARAPHHVDHQLDAVAVREGGVLGRLLLVDEGDDRGLLVAVEALAADDVDGPQSLLEGELVLIPPGELALGEQVVELDPDHADSSLA